MSSPGPTFSTLVHVKYGSNKSLVVNPNAGLSGIMDFIRRSLMGIGVSDKDHLELCDENGKLINPDDFPSMMLLSAFMKVQSDEVVFIPIKVERDASKQISRLEPMLTEPEKAEIDILLKMKKENHVPREKKYLRGESATAKNQVQHDGSSSSNSVGHSLRADSRKNQTLKSSK